MGVIALQRLQSMMRRLLQPFWVLLAVIFLIEAWLWDHLEPIVERIVALIPRRLPQPSGILQRISKPVSRPKCPLIASTMQLIMMRVTHRDGELIRDLHRHRSRLRKA